MNDATFDALIQRHEMGQAYKLITENMGPSPQLLAFINFDQVNDGNFGLESLNIMDQHQKTLVEIENDQSLNIACESLADGLKKYRGWLLGAGATIAVLTGGLGLISAALLASGGAGVYIKSKEGDVVSHDSFVKLSKAFSQAARAESMFATAIPSTLDEKAWASFRENYVGGDLFEADEETGRLRSEAKGDKVDFAKSGWSIDTFKAAFKWFNESEKKVKELNAKQADKIDKIEKLMASNETKGAKVLKDVSMMLKTARSSTQDTTKILSDVESILRGVANHFGVNKN